MKILWLSHNVPYPPQGGVLQRNFHLLRETASRAEVHLVALRQIALCPDEAALDEARGALSRLCASVHVFPIDWEMSAARRAALAIPVALGLRAYDHARFESSACARHLEGLEHDAFDVVHVDTIGLDPLVVPSWPCARVLNHHNIESHMLARRAANASDVVNRAVLRLMARRLREAERRAAPQYDRNFVVSDIDGERLQAIAPAARVAVIPNGVDIAFFDGREASTPDERTIVFVGGLSWHPNRDAVAFFLDEIWPRIAAAEPLARFVMIGRNPSRAALDAAARDPRVRALGFVDDIRDEVARAAVFVAPFREGGGSRLKMLDALAMRKAIVATAVGAEGLPLVDGRHFRLADAAAPFAERVVELLRDPAARRRLGDAGRALVVERFDWRVVGDALFAVYDDVVRNRTPRSPRGTRTPAV